jgi:hypothetical protein
MANPIDPVQLLESAIQAHRAGARDLAAQLAERAARVLRGDGLPWRGPARERGPTPEFAERARRLLGTFAAAGRRGLTDLEARALARHVFPEGTRVMGPSFYRPGYLVVKPDGRVALTPRGRAFLTRLDQLPASSARGHAVAGKESL